MKERLRVKEEYLEKWEEELCVKANKLSSRSVNYNEDDEDDLLTSNNNNNNRI